MSKCKREDCSNPVAGRQSYCTDKCRQRARKGSRALRYRTGQNRQISLIHPVEHVEEFQPTLANSDFGRSVIDLVGTDLRSEVVATEMERLKPVPASAYKHLKLELVNAATWKVVDPNIKTDVPAKLGHWGGYRTTKALAWVIDLGYGQWIARCRNEVCNPTNLAEAKRQALAMAVGGIGDYQVSDPIKEYQELSAIIEARYAPEFKVVEVPTALSGESKSLQGDDYPLTYDANGYPELPACLDRRPKPPLAKAA